MKNSKYSLAWMFMPVDLTFKRWIQFQETIVPFGAKFAGKDISEIPSWWLNFALGFYEGRPQMTLAIKREIEQTIKKRGDEIDPSSGIKVKQGPPQAAQGQSGRPPQVASRTNQSGRPPQAAQGQSPSPSKTNRNWIWAKSLTQHDEGITPGEDIGLANRLDGNWDFISLDDRQIEGVLNKDEVIKTVQSIKDQNGKIIMSKDFNELKKMAEESHKSSNPYQDKIVDAFGKTDKNMIINALAGTGKTTTLKRLAKEFKKPGEIWLYLVFNKKNQTEAEKKFPSSIQVKTSHAFLGEVLKNNAELGLISSSSIPPKSEETGKSRNKIGEMIDNPEFATKSIKLGVPSDMIKPFKNRVKKLTTFAKHYALQHTASNAELYNLISSHNIDTTLLSKQQLEQNNNPTDYSGQIVEMTKEMLHQSMPGISKDQELRRLRDHDDTLWWTAIHADQLKWPKFKVVLADEVQDFNRDQLIMLKKLAEQGARIIAVGDPNQAIYRFRGADAKSFTNIENMLKSLPNSSTTHDLPVNFRSGKEIINFANENTHVKGLQAGKSHAGIVTTNKTHDDVMDKISSEWKTNGKLKHQTAFIARTNAPLVDTAIQLLKNNMNFTIIGRDFSDELVQFIENIAGKNRYDIEDFLVKMNDYVYEKEIAWHGKANKEDDLKELKQTSEAMSSVISYLQSNNWKDPKTGIVVRTHKDLIYLFKKLFAGLNADENGADAKAYERIDPKNTVILTTAHRSKGLEFDRVYIKCPDIFNRKANNEEDQQQEDNAKYVAFTRATHQLHVLDEECLEKKDHG